MTPFIQYFNLKAERGLGWQSQERGYKGKIPTRREMPVHRLAFVTMLSSDIVPPGTARVCAARTMI